MRKFLALVLALVMTMSLVTVSAGAATDFTDDAKIVNAEAVEVLNAMGVLGGYDDGSFRPQATLTRGAGAKLIAYLMLGQAKADKLTATYTVFEDVTDTVGLAPYIEWAAAQGVLGGYGDGNFGPYNPLTEYAFGKMLLGALGYDTEVEGYTGAGWQKNVYRDANYAGIYDGTESYGACTRDTAARMMLGALKANVVAYGTSMVGGNGAIYWNGELLGNNFAMVDGRIETNRALWTFYDGLTYTALCADVWGRPGHNWEYDTKDVDFDKFYMDAPVATYTTAVKECDILVDFGVSKTDKDDLDIQYVVNGDAAAVAANESHVDCATYHGGQGTLTQLFEVENDINANDRIDAGETFYVVTSIDTYLTYVKSVTTTAHKFQGITTLEIYEDDAYDSAATNEKGTDIVIDDSIGYAAKDYVLINVAKFNSTAALAYLNGNDATLWGVDSEVYYDVNTTKDYVAVVGAPSVLKAAKFSGVAADKTLATVNGIQTPVASQYELSECLLDFAKVDNYDFFVDQYGNLIGDAKLTATFTYGVITDLQFEQAALGETSYADVALVGADAVKNTIKMYRYDDKVVTEGAADPDNAVVNRYNVNNDSYYFYTTAASDLGVVRVYELPTGGYNLVSVDADTNEAQVMDFTAKITKGDATLNRANGTTAVVDNDTIFVVKTLNAAGAAVYTQYVGVNAVPSMVNVNYVAVYEKDVAAEFVYVDATKGYFVDNTKLAFITNADLTYSETGETYTYKAWIDCVETSVKVSKNALNAAALFAGEEGLYELRFNADGIVTEVALKASLLATDTTFDGTAFDDADWVYETVAGVSNNVTVTFSAAPTVGYSIVGAKVVKVLFTETVTDATSVWANDNGETLVGVAAGTTADIAKDAQVIYKLNTAGTAVDTIYVLAESFN